MVLPVLAATVLAACTSTGTEEGNHMNATNGASANDLFDPTLADHMIAEAQSELHEDFLADFVFTGSGTTTESVQVAQEPPDVKFQVPGGELISNGTTTDFCSTGSTGQTSCVPESTGGTNPVSALESDFSSSAFVAEVQAAAGLAHTHGYTVTTSTTTVAGQPSTCVTEAYGGQTSKYCDTTTGVPDDIQTPGYHFMMISFTTVIPGNEFVLPSGSTTPTPGSSQSPTSGG